MNARRLCAITAIAVAAVLVSACGNDAGSAPAGGNSPTMSSSNGGTGGGVPGKPSCALVPASLVNSVLGVSMGEPAETVNSVVMVCDYAPTSGNGGVTVRFQSNEDETGFALGRAGFKDSGQPTVDLPGFFDQAFSSTLGNGTLTVNTVVARKGTIEILVTSHAPIEKEKDLITKIFAALG
jgi:hypothetical protein